MSLAKWELVQKRAFTHWVNSQLAKRDVKLESLEEGLQSGVHLIDLIEILTGKQVPLSFTSTPIKAFSCSTHLLLPHDFCLSFFPCSVSNLVESSCLSPDTRFFSFSLSTHVRRLP